MCGGIVGFKCKEGLECKIKKENPTISDQSGTCQKPAGRDVKNNPEQPISQEGEICHEHSRNSHICADGLVCGLLNEIVGDAGSICYKDNSTDTNSTDTTNATTVLTSATSTTSSTSTNSILPQATSAGYLVSGYAGLISFLLLFVLI
ncbi:hypothetical protein HK099_002719 [Clydaea vesicula]|uniref:Uncharacterized protein n=1 Tax=Clydaea vesicula TaxID=447962 RepID=A0AAD5TSV2_9FUNG|nr:hypothetical protein HK099_002719 [Clydaea vesicula]